MTIGERIKLLREDKKITQSELAERIGTTKQNIYKYENGIITNIPSDKIEAIAYVLGVSPIYIMGWGEQKEPVHAEDDTNGLRGILKVFSSEEVDELCALSRDQANQVVDLIRKLHSEK